MKYTKSFLNYPGGKYRIINKLLQYFPSHVKRFVDLFEGSGVVTENYYGASSYLANDINKPLVQLQRYILSIGIYKFNREILNIISKYHLTYTYNYGYKYYNSNSQIGLSKVNREGYLKLRKSYNNSPTNPKLYVLITYGFNNQIRFNRSGKFNNPCGKRDWNGSMKHKLRDFYVICKSKRVKFTNKDFQKINVYPSDFIYADPPYLITTAVYNGNSSWNLIDDRRLFTYLDNINKLGAKFAMSNVLFHKGRKNNPLIKWSKKYHVYHIKNSYNNSNYHTKNGKSDEVLITNYVK